MKFRLPAFAILLVAAALSGCISPKSVIDPTYPKVAYEDLKRNAEPPRLKLSVEFQRNGSPHPKADPFLRDNAERVLRASGIVTPTSEPGDGEIHIVMNNIADMGSAAAKGFGTGLTFGLVGSTVTDAYEMSVTITIGNRSISRTSIKHAIHTAVGNASLPEGLETLPPSIAASRVLEQMLLRALQDMQKAGELAWLLDRRTVSIPSMASLR